MQTEKAKNLLSVKYHRLAINLSFLFTIFIPAKAYAAPAPTNCNNANANALQNCVQNNPIVKDLQSIVDFLSIGVGIVVVAMIIIGGIQYAAAGDNPNTVTAAKQRLTNALIALGAYLVTFAFLQWLIPGGVFN